MQTALSLRPQVRKKFQGCLGYKVRLCVKSKLGTIEMAKQVEVLFAKSDHEFEPCDRMKELTPTRCLSLMHSGIYIYPRNK